jgi:DNA-binding CsgD family transcriptional regulator
MGREADKIVDAREGAHLTVETRTRARWRRCWQQARLGDAAPVSNVRGAMHAFDRAESFLREIAAAADPAALADCLAAISRELGFSYFALSHHVDVRTALEPAIRLHNYPDDWVEYYDSRKLGVSDPVHRASHLTSVGFAWSDIPGLISLTPGDLEILERAEGQGIGNGFTVPANVPGESNGSCSFASPRGTSLRAEEFPIAQLVGSFAFEAARKLWRMRSPVTEPFARLTDRQRECVLWMARGKSDWEISQILGITHETVIRHLKHARERYGVSKRTMVAIQALFEGAFSFNDVLRR